MLKLVKTQAPYDAELLHGDRQAPHPPLQLRRQRELIEPTAGIPLAAANVTMLRALQDGQRSRRGQVTRLRWRLRSSRHPSAVPDGSLATATWFSHSKDPSACFDRVDKAKRNQSDIFRPFFNQHLLISSQTICSTSEHGGLAMSDLLNTGREARRRVAQTSSMKQVPDLRATTRSYNVQRHPVR